MLSTIPIKKRIKILFQLSCVNDDILYFSKISHILSQHNVFESHLVDEFFIKLFKGFNFKLSPNDLTWKFIGSLKVPVIIDIYKKKYKTEILVCGFDVISLFKKLMDRRYITRYLNKDKKKKFNPANHYSVLEALKIVLLSNMFFLGLHIFNYSKFKKKVIASKLVSLTLKDRFQMKARKVNFKRKDKKKK